MSFVLSWNCGTSPTSPQSRYSASFVKACNWSHSNKTSASTNILNSWSPPSLSANFPNLSYEPPTYVCLWVNRTVRTSHVNKIIALFLHLYALVRLASGQTGCGHGNARTLLRRIKTTSLMPLKRVRGVHNVSRLLLCRYGQYKSIALLDSGLSPKQSIAVAFSCKCTARCPPRRATPASSIQRFRRSILSATPETPPIFRGHPVGVGQSRGKVDHNGSHYLG